MPLVYYWIMTRLIIAGALMFLGVIFALFFLFTGQFFLCIFSLGITAALAGWPAGGIIKATQQLKDEKIKWHS